MLRPLLLALICLTAEGCREQAKLSTESEVPSINPRAAVKLTILLVDDPELAKGIELLSGEWSERSGGELTIESISKEDFLAAEHLNADVVIYPSRLLGTLVMRDWLRPVRQSVLDSSDLAYSDILPVIRDQTMRYGGEVWGVPLGEMPLCLGWTGDTQAKLPATWEQLAELPFPRRSEFKLAIEFPLAAELIARAVAATPRGNRAALFFDPETMDARLNQPQIVRALEQMRGVITKDASKEKFAANVTLPPRGKQFNYQLTPLLPADETFDLSLNRWEKSTIAAPPVICGFSGRLVSVTRSTRNAASAFKLLPWLVSGNTGSQLSQRSKSTLWFRTSQVSQAVKWLPAKSAAENADWLTRALSTRDAYLLPRLPGIDDYLATLDKALADAPSAEALTVAEKKWDTLTESQGRVQQLKAFRLHLGLPE
ncbi:hypothetical protein [Bythopirellula polymerisocia]|uniref:Bacterial extracellular solute-binding protein n=1 Tax=Bythopirellula polymerisocia TaxID=2528003 RepID=A0A5C6CNG7_9BACT|nr:hypothetical protein [Bythopirellula polymerisocia]TWU25928.1 hypothetical protein Pla144_31420 [Bythopirellula polymerisocia]